MKRLLSIFGLLPALSSCSVTRTVGIGGSRPEIRFENVEAARTFYEAVLDEQFPSGTGNSLTLALAPLYIKSDDVKDGAAILAEAMPRADRDGNGTIGVSEAHAFAASITPITR